PPLQTESADGRRLVDLVRSIEGIERSRPAQPTTRLAEWRAEIDALVIRSYGLSREDARLVLADFPLLDRGQPPLAGEDRSTITRDLVLDAVARLEGEEDPGLRERVEAAREQGAEGYVPAQLAAAKRAPEAAVIG
ncbi:MAG TPA: hypothetical protein VF504_02240, partial [Solirubrobacterales bacterium]